VRKTLELSQLRREEAERAAAVGGRPTEWCRSAGGQREGLEQHAARTHRSRATASRSLLC
jgi:LmbE family N-acetylglucosaminyl deacetylase